MSDKLSKLYSDLENVERARRKGGFLSNAFGGANAADIRSKIVEEEARIQAEAISKATTDSNKNININQNYYGQTPTYAFAGITKEDCIEAMKMVYKLAKGNFENYDSSEEEFIVSYAYFTMIKHEDSKVVLDAIEKAFKNDKNNDADNVNNGYKPPTEEEKEKLITTQPTETWADFYNNKK